MNYSGIVPMPANNKKKGVISKMHHLEEGPVHLKRGSVIGKRWKVVTKIGEGGCGAVYKVEDVEAKAEAALKVESNFVPGGSVLKLEVQILKRLEGKPHVAQLLQSGKKAAFSYMVMTLLGDSLNHLLKKCHRQCSVSTQVRVGINVLYGLKQIHDIGFVHRDLKPANLAVGPPDAPAAHYVHILDFGLSREFVMQGPDNKLCMRRPRARCLFRGTTRYCSVNTHDKGEQSRVDDLWSLLYLLAELRGPLPWNSCRDKKEVCEMKRNISDKTLLFNSPVQLLEIADHLRKLSYYCRPNYRFIYDKLFEVMIDGGFGYTDSYDWERLGKGPKSKEPDSREKIGSKETGMSTAHTVASSEDPTIASTIKPTISKHSKIDVNCDQLPQAHYNDPNNPFPAEDFDTNPLGF